MALREYRRKRNFKRTLEPQGKVTQSGGASLFVVQKHDATRLHYDFRLELDGVLKSWAVPKGPSLDPAVKALAIEVEDHPVAYATFEGVIPAGEYGGGTVLVWDHGTWSAADDDPRRALRKGHLKFQLHGEKLKGGWSLIRIRKEGDRQNWLLLKHGDDAAVSGDGHGITERERASVLTQRELTQVATDADRVWTRHGVKRGSKRPAVSVAMKAAARRTVARAGQKRTTPKRSLTDADATPANIAGAVAAKFPRKLSPQLALLADRVPVGPEWLHEVKFDGYRILAELSGGTVRLLTRNGNDWTDKFPETAKGMKSLGLQSAVIDGELVALDSHGVANFQRLQNAIRERRTAELVYYAFDLPYLSGYDLRAATLLDRKQALERLLLAHVPANDGAIRYSDHIQGDGAAVLEQSCKAALEGVICKRANSPYETRRSGAWIKVKCHGRQEFVIAGFTQPEGSRVGFGALLLGYFENARLQYAGRVGTGFDQRLLSSLRKRLDRMVVDRSPFTGPLPTPERRGVTFVRPELVAEIEFSEWTDEGRLRHPSFQGLRDDKAAVDVIRERPGAGPKTARKQASPRKVEDRPASKPAKMAEALAGVSLTHPDRLLFPDAGVTKLDLARYYMAISDWVLPHVVARPLSLVRCPNGSTGKCFYQKHWTHTLPEDVGTVAIREKAGQDMYVQIENLAGLVSLVQISVLEIHPWGARSDNVEQPDRVVIDLDPGPDVAWSAVVDSAKDVRKVLDKFELECFLRTSGGKGLHIVIPLARRNTWEEIETFAHDVANGLATHAGDRYVANMRKALRIGRIYVDYLRNQRGSTAIASYSTRSRTGCPVATPIDWSELKKLRSAADFTIANVPARLASLKRDPWERFADVRQSLTRSALDKAAAFARP